MKYAKYINSFITILILVALAGCSNKSNFTALTVHQQESVFTQTPEYHTVVSLSEKTPAFDQEQLKAPITPLRDTSPNIFSQTSTPNPVIGNYLFTEDPATDLNGNVYFSDINAGKIYKWSPDGIVKVFLGGLNMPNGLMFDSRGNLIACEGGKSRLISIDAQGGIYFTDPVYQGALAQDGEHVYYLSPDHSQLTRVITDMIRPNGLVGTADGKTLYVADQGAGQTFAYTINTDGTLSNKRLFVATGSDGMDLDADGNLYLTNSNHVQIFDSTGNLLHTITTAENPTNIAFAGADGKTLFITARTAVYTLPMSTNTFNAAPVAPATSNADTFTLTSPDLPVDGRLPIEYTCDGARSTLALIWSGAPTGTVGYAVTMHHIAGADDIHWYWEVYNLPASITSLAKNNTRIGTLGTNSVNDRQEYTPPCSKGPGDKEYIYTVYALSAQPQFSVPASRVDRATLLAAIKDITLDSAELHVVYARP